MPGRIATGGVKASMVLGVAPSMATLRYLRRSLSRSFGKTLGTRCHATTTHTPPAFEGEYRENQLHIQMLSRSLHRQVFRGVQREPNSRQIELAKEQLQSFGLYGKTTAPLADLSIPLPPLVGQDIEKHFYALGHEQSHVYFNQATTFANVTLPPIPTKWVQKSGWTQYDAQGNAAPVPYPADDALVFDVEVIVGESPYAVMATAASATHWYAWVSPELLKKKPSASLIPLGKRDAARVIVGHHVAFDRARVLEEYAIERTRYGWLDTLSLHCAYGGVSSQQRPEWMRFKKLLDSENVEEIEANLRKWMEVSSPNSLKDVAELYLGEHSGTDFEPLDKTLRDIFVKGSSSDVMARFQDLMTYCARDVAVTHKVYKRILPFFLQKCPHPVSFAGMLHMGRGYLPVTSDWHDKYIASADRECATSQAKITEYFETLAEEALKLGRDDKWKHDPWLKHLDWTTKPQRMTKEKRDKAGNIIEPARPYSKSKLPGMPEWYRDLWDSKAGKIKITTRKSVTPYLLKLQWNGYPLYKSANHGWTFMVPKAEAGTIKLPPLNFLDDENEKALASPDHVYFRVPHKDGNDVNCGDPLSKYNIHAFEEGVLTSKYPMALEILRLNAQCTYWISAQERVKTQFVVYEDKKGKLGILSGRDGQRGGVILPQSIVMGTITRRAVESTWLTASNAKKNRIGSELKAQVKAPKGYAMVGADVDSQELWISAILADAQFRIHGATPFGYMTLQGTKAAGTDLHSMTGKILGISRDKAKVFNYSRIYGAGRKHAVQLLLQANPKLHRQEAEAKVKELFASTKGLRSKPGDILPRGFWYGGSESFVFNQLEGIAQSDYPKTPVLGCEIPEGLRPDYCGKDFMTSRVNWAVQSSGVDYLHLLLVSMDYLMRRFSIRGRFMLSIHDEVRFLSHQDDAYRMALALQISNLWVRSLFASRVGMDDLPLSVAFFSGVDIDHCMRKEVDMDCVTPSNGEPIPPGECLSMAQLMVKLDTTGDWRGYGDEIPSVAQAATHLEAADPAYRALSKRREDPITVADLFVLEIQMAKSARALNKLRACNTEIVEAIQMQEAERLSMKRHAQQVHRAQRLSQSKPATQKPLVPAENSDAIVPMIE